MKEFATENIRNFCLAGQRGSGKTSLADGIAFLTGANNRIGRVDDGSSFFDYTEGELSRNTSLSSKLLATTWQKTKINLLDCPGHPDFTGEFVSSQHVSEAVCFVLDALSGVEVGTQLHWNLAREQGLARFFLVNKMDKENVKWQSAVESIKSSYGNGAVPVQLPIGEADSFKGVVDLLNMKAYTYDGGKAVEGDIPGDLKADAESMREQLIESAAEGDDALMEKFFDAGTLTDDELRQGLLSGISSGQIYPILFSAASGNIGSDRLLEFVANYIPAPNQTGEVPAVKGEEESTIKVDPNGQPVAFVFRTISEGHLGEMSLMKMISGTLSPGNDLVNVQSSASERFAQLYTMQGKNRQDLQKGVAGDIVVAVKLKDTKTNTTLAPKGFGMEVKAPVYPNPVTDVAVRAKSKGEEDKVAGGFTKLHLEDPTFHIDADPALKQQVLWAQGSTQIEVLVEKLKSRFGVEVELVRPKIPYRETIRGKTEKQYRHKKQSGGRGQFGDVHIRIEPNERGGGFEFADEITGGVIPSKYIPAVEKGVVEQMQHGGLCGAPVVDVKVALYFGSFHDVDSSDMAFKIAGSMAFKEGYMECKPVILEPIYNLEILVPDDFTGDVMGDVSSRRGKVQGMDPEGGYQRIRAAIPQAELYQYSVDLRSMTQGQGVYTMEFSHYEDVPHDAAQKVIDAAKAEQEAEG